VPKALKTPLKPEVAASKALSLLALPGDGNIATRRIAILVANGVDGEAAQALHAGLTAAGAVPRYVGARLGSIKAESGDSIEVEVTFETMPSVLFDALAVPGGKGAAATLGKLGQVLEFIKDQYRHAKPILALGEGADLIENAGAPALLSSGAPDPGMLVGKFHSVEEALPSFIKAIARHRHHERETDPPPV
jgi:catalase